MRGGLGLIYNQWGWEFKKNGEKLILKITTEQTSKML
jgi:hypothetical protein